MFEFRLRLGAEVDLCARAAGKLAMPGNEVGVQMCLDDVLDRETMFAPASSR